MKIQVSNLFGNYFRLYNNTNNINVSFIYSIILHLAAIAIFNFGFSKFTADLAEDFELADKINVEFIDDGHEEFLNKQANSEILPVNQELEIDEYLANNSAALDIGHDINPEEVNYERLLSIWLKKKLEQAGLGQEKIDQSIILSLVINTDFIIIKANLEQATNISSINKIIKDLLYSLYFAPTKPDFYFDQTSKFLLRFDL